MNMNLISIKNEELRKAGIPLSRNTFYAWSSRGKYKEMFVKLGGRLFIDTDKFWEIVPSTKAK